MVDTIVDNISLRTERKIEMDLQISTNTSAIALANFAQFLRTITANHQQVMSSIVFVSESGKQFHTIHVECLIPLEVDLPAFQMLREELNLAAVSYANEHQIAFAETK